MTSWKQERYFLMKQNVDENPRENAVNEILQEITNARRENFEIIVMADLNESIHDKNKANNDLFSLGLINVFDTKLDICPRSYKGGSKMIDHIV